MKTPALIDLFQIAPAVEQHVRPLFQRSYGIRFGKIRYLYNCHLKLCQQWYDARQVFFYIIEIQASQHVELPIHILHPDTHWLYQLTGRSAIPALQLELESLYHSTLSIRPGHYALHFGKGDHLLAGFVAEQAWMKRHACDDTHFLQKHMGFLNSDMPSRAALVDIQKISPPIQKDLLLLANTNISPGIALDGQLSAYAGRIIEQHCNLYKTSSTDTEAYSLTRSIHKYIGEAAVQDGEIPRIEEIAEHFNMQTKELRKAHRLAYGENPKTYLMRSRLDHAYHLLKTTEFSPTEIAYKLGFSHLSHFSRLFKKQYGISPSEV